MSLEKKPKKAIVIGSGIAGLASSIRLANKGYRVDVFEKNNYPGGKLTSISIHDFRFDAGPSLFTLPELVDELFELSGKNPKEYFNYKKLNVLCNYFFEDGTFIKTSADVDEFAKEIENKTIDSATSIKKHLKKSAFIYQATSTLFLNKSLHKLTSYFSINTFISILKLPFLNIFSSMNRVNERVFKDEKNIQLFNRYATYNGSNPYQAPGILNIIPHLEYNMGAYFPEKGMHSITMALYHLAEDLGVNFHFNTSVEEITKNKHRVTGIIDQNGDHHKSEIIISNSDVHFVYSKLLKSKKQLTKVDAQERSSSALIFYWGINKTFKELDLHNIFFSNDYKNEFENIFNEQLVYKDPTVYINITSKLNPKDAPANCENWFVMINTPSNYNQDWDEIIKKSRGNIINKLNRLLGVDLKKHIVCEEILDPLTIESKTRSYKGSLYGTASNKRNAAFFRHKNFSSEYSNLFFVGGSVHPGGGIPLALSSAKIVDKLIK